MHEYYPLLVVGAIIGAFTVCFVTAFALMKNKKQAIGFDRRMKDGELIRRLAQPAVPLPDCSRSPRRPLRARLAQMLQKNRLGILGSCLYGGIMLCLYLLTGVGAYLIGSLSLIAIGGATFYVRRRS